MYYYAVYMFSIRSVCDFAYLIGVDNIVHVEICEWNENVSTKMENNGI